MARLTFEGLSVKAFVAEFLATSVFVFIGTGTASTFAATQQTG